MSRRLAQLARTLIAAAVVVLLVRTLVVVGLATPLVVDGSSMAPTLLGPHVLVECPRCGEAATVGLDQLPEEQTFFCPACDRAELSIGDGEARPGDRIVVDRLTKPRRWDVVVAHRPEEATRLAVKRVLGLPGESVTLDAGDLVVNGSRIAKSLNAQRRLRIPIHKERSSNTRWRAANVSWRFQNNTWRASPAANQAATLTYRHPGDFTDDLPHNQQVSRRLNKVGDLMLTAQVKLAAGARCDLAVVTLRGFLSATLNANANEATLSHSNSEPHNSPLPGALRSGAEVTLSTFDRRAMLAVGDEVLAEFALAEAFAESLTSFPPQFVVVATGGEVAVSDLRLWRDVYYEARAVDTRPPWRLGADEWLLVGDNQAISLDSRNSGRGVPGRLMVGRVLGGHFVRGR